MVADDRTLPDEIWTTLVRAALDGDVDDRRTARSLLVDPDARVRVVAMRAVFTDLSDDELRGALSDVDATVRREALTLLSRTTMRRAVVEEVERALRDPEPLVVEAACHCLGEWFVSTAGPSLARVAREHPDARCRETAVAAIGVLGDDLATVLAALDDKPSVRRRAIVALSNFEGPAVDAALARAADDRDWQVRAAVEQLRRDDD